MAHMPATPMNGKYLGWIRIEIGIAIEIE